MDSKKPFYLTTTLPYVNARPHIGFALEMVQADITIRYRALKGEDVFFSTGTDEHGLKIFRKAAEEGKDTQAYVDEYAAQFRELKKLLNLYPELHFVRTTDPHHKAAAQEMWRRCAASGDIYKKKYKGLYCVGDEAFIKETDLVNGKCPNHPTMDLLEIEEENYFFRLSAYQEKILAYLSQEGVIVPEWRRDEAINFVKGGLEDFSVSREESRLPWGIPVPDDETQVMYVWFDALTNYISTLGWPEDAEGNFKKFWQEGETLQMAGKDQVRFQSVMWQAMLMSAGIKNTDTVFYHGFITSGGQKMSKSIGNVIDPYDLIEEYGADAVRYFLARHVHPFEDSDFTMERFKEVYNADLANGLGNLVARIMKLAETNLSNPVQFPQDTIKFDEDADENLISALNEYRFNDALSFVFESISYADSFIQIHKPFLGVKDADQNLRSKALEDINTLRAMLWNIASYLIPFMPETSKAIFSAIKDNKKPENLFLRKE